MENYSMPMDCKLNKWGNSYAVRIPQSLLKELGIQENDLLDISLQKGQIVLKKKNPYSLKEMLKNITPDNLHSDSWPDYYPVGKENVW